MIEIPVYLSKEISEISGYGNREFNVDHGEVLKHGSLRSTDKA